MLKIDSELAPSIRFTFRVNNIDLQEIISNPAPDSNINNIILQLKAQTIWIPYVPYPLKYGDTFTLEGQEALETYKNFINKKPKILEIVYN
jgi:hypothetical protein